MAEGKKRLYRRDTVKRSLESFVEQAKKVLDGDIDLPDKLIHAIVFGSFVNTDNDRVHDLDIGIVVREHREKWMDYITKHPELSTGDWFNDLYLPQIMMIKFLKNGKGIISIHYFTEEEFRDCEDYRRILTDSEHVYLVKDRKFCGEGLEQLDVHL